MYIELMGIEGWAGQRRIIACLKTTNKANLIIFVPKLRHRRGLVVQ